MVPYDVVADAILRQVAGFVRMGDPARLRRLDGFPLAVYVTDRSGFITYFNSACVAFAGRSPTLLRDRWCVSWKLYTNDGDFVAHDRCPMAIAIQTRQAVRGISAVAERPDGTRVNFLPFPTPVIGEAGELLSAINLLIDITGQAHRIFREQDGRVMSALSMLSIEDIRDLVAEIEICLGQKHPRFLN